MLTKTSSRRGDMIMSFLLLTSITTRIVSSFTTTTTTSTTRLVSRKYGIFGTMLTNNNYYNKQKIMSLSNNNNIGYMKSYTNSMKFMSTTTQQQYTDDEIKQIEEQIKMKGDEIRQLKADGIDKESLAPHIDELKTLKAKIAPPPSQEENEKKKKSNNNQKGKKAQPKQESEMSESELRAARLQKVQLMKEAGVEPYEYTYNPTHSAMELQSLYEGKLEGGEEDEEADVAVAGRVMAKRVFGKLAFFTLQDESGTMQLHLEKNRLGDSFKVC